MVEPTGVSPRIKHLQRENEEFKVQIIQLRRENLSLKKGVAQNTTNISGLGNYIQVLEHDLKELRDLFYRWFGQIPTKPLTASGERFITTYVPIQSAQTPVPQEKSEMFPLRPSPLADISQERADQTTKHPPLKMTRHLLVHEIREWVHQAAKEHCIDTGERATVACLSTHNLVRFRTAIGCYDNWVLDPTGIIALQVDTTLGDHEITILSTSEVTTSGQQQALAQRPGA